MTAGSVAALRVAAALTVTLVALTLAVLAVDPLPGESAALRAVRLEPTGAARGGWQAVSDATDLLPVALVALAAATVLLGVGAPGAALLVGLSPLVAATATRLVKLLVARDRPELMLPADASMSGFPSGHAAHSAALVLAALGLLLPALDHRGRVVAVALAVTGLAAVGYGQLALARHFPSDLLAGWLLGGACVALLVAGLDRLRLRPLDGRR